MPLALIYVYTIPCAIWAKLTWGLPSSQFFTGKTSYVHLVTGSNITMECQFFLVPPRGMITLQRCLPGGLTIAKNNKNWTVTRLVRNDFFCAEHFTVTTFKRGGQWANCLNLCSHFILMFSLENSLRTLHAFSLIIELPHKTPTVGFLVYKAHPILQSPLHHQHNRGNHVTVNFYAAVPSIRHLPDLYNHSFMSSCTLFCSALNTQVQITE